MTLTECVDFYTSMNIRYRGICEINPESQKIEFLNFARNFGHARAVNIQTWENLKQYGYIKLYDFNWDKSAIRPYL